MLSIYANNNWRIFNRYTLLAGMYTMQYICTGTVIFGISPSTLTPSYYQKYDLRWEISWRGTFHHVSFVKTKAGNNPSKYDHLYIKFCPFMKISRVCMQACLCVHMLRYVCFYTCFHVHFCFMNVYVCMRACMHAYVYILYLVMFITTSLAMLAIWAVCLLMACRNIALSAR